ncbi:hypothetical protein S7711_02000 [Stachybotrys chartarum IBT 7711]|uniref:CBM1 domain-containing protein n=1 Tax=Stachybotrys chartarum (strain CBS 109288 / IBT 7711) TaxID=1280523 RepID=A0A084AVY0_STACB|nr:hypothetical protein S7711_02000 [Stachybotrys chartarum IBT 7711]
MRLLAVLAAVAPAWAAYDWENVRIGGGGGFVPGISFHPAEPGLAYARTDIGGLYRLNADDSWTALTDSITFHDTWNRWGIDALALDPQDPDLVYAAVGMYTNSWDPNNGTIIKSTDRGDTWTTFTSLPFKVGGNNPGRGMGERLAVDPHNSNIIYFGARSGNGLWRSTDAGRSFTRVSTFTNVGTYIQNPADLNDGYGADLVGLAFVTFDSTSAVTGGATSRIFVGVADNITASVYVSENAGATWAPLAGQPGRYFPHKAVLQPDERALYLSYADGVGPYDGASGSVWRYDIAGRSWRDITPVAPADLINGYGGLSVDLQVPGTLMVATLNMWWPDGQIYRSTDSGATWSVLWEWDGYPNLRRYFGVDNSRAPWIQTNFFDVGDSWVGWMMESLEIDPHDSDHWLYGTGLTIFGGHDLTNWDTVHNVTIASLADGIEELSIQDLASAPGGSELLVAAADSSGFTFRSASDLDTAPEQLWGFPTWATSVTADYAGNRVANVIRVGPSAGQAALSTDGGITWTAGTGVDAYYGGSVAYSANADVIVWSTGGSGVVRSVSGAAFAAVASLPSGTIVASDKRNSTYFYAGSGASFYVSSNSGSSFAVAGALTGATSVRDIVAHPIRAGEVLVSTDLGVFRSTNFGASFTRLAGSVTDTQQISFGLGAGSNWNVYAFGHGSAGARLYGTPNLGTTWTDIQGGIQGFGNINSCDVVGSGNVPGQVYVGTNGRGVFYAQGTLPGGSVSSSSSAVSTRTTSSSSVRTTSSVRVSTTSSIRVSTTSSARTTSTLSTSTRTSSSAAPTNTATAGPWAQCGGNNWTGPTRCTTGWTCTFVNDWYSQCLQ